MKKYKREEALNESIKYFNGDDLSANVWVNKYALKDSNGNIYEKTPDDMHWRIANELHRIESKYKNPLSKQEIFDSIKDFKYIVPQGSPMAGIGNDFQISSISNCFVVGPRQKEDGNAEDSYGSILKVDQEIIQLCKRRAGVGTTLEHIRPFNSEVKNAALTSTGVVPFMERYSNSIREVAQAGRRGALMLSTHVKSIDSKSFIDAKTDTTKVTGANISVKIDDEFMSALKEGRKYKQQFPIVSDDPSQIQEIDPKEIWDKLIENNWKCFPYDTKLYVYENGKRKLMKIGDLYNVEKKGKTYKTWSLNLKTNKIELNNITDFQKYKNNKNIYTIKTKSGKEISLTEDHILYKLGINGIEPTKSMDFNIGDYISISRKEFEENEKEDYIDLLDSINDNIFVEVDEKVSKILEYSDIGKFDNGYKKTTYYKNYGKIPLKDFKKLKVDQDYNYNIILNRTEEKYNRFLKISKDLALFIGIWLAEGTSKQNNIRLNINKNEFKYYKNIIENLSKEFKFNFSTEIDNNSMTVNINSSMLKNIIDMLNIREDGNKKISEQIFKFNKKNISYILNGLFSGDGTVSKSIISLFQSNLNLLKQVSELLTVFGIQSRIDKRNSITEKIINGKLCNVKEGYNLTVFKLFNEKFKEKIGLTIDEKHSKIEKCERNNIFNIPSFYIKENKDKFNTRIDTWGRKTISLEKIAKYCNDEKSNDLLLGDILYDEIISIEKNSIYSEYVYDITVENNHTFLLSNSIIVSNSAEPGILFWDTIERESIPDCYADLGYKSIGTNPCVVGNTKVSVADGRGYVEFSKLAEEGNDVPVYSLDRNGKLCIRKMRNPRISGYNQKIYKVAIEGGHEIRVTGNHKFRLKDGTYKEAKNLSTGDSLHIMTKVESGFENNPRSSDYYWLMNGERKTKKSEHRFIYEQTNETKIKKGYVIHHVDFDSRNNSIDNLKLMTKEDHDRYHSERIKGENNPYHKMNDNWKFNFASHPGEENPNYSDITNEEIIEHFKSLIIKLNRRISYNDWKEYAKENKLPQYFSQYRKNILGDITTLSKKIALEIGLDYTETDPRLVKTYKKALENGYDAEINGNEVQVIRNCENCGKSFKVNYFKREKSFCNNECSLVYLNSDTNINKKRTESVNNSYKLKSEKTKTEQLKIYNDLKFELGRKPTLKEWENVCKNNNIPFRLKTKHGFKNFTEISKESEVYNHKVLSVVEDGYENVYNGTVDEFHNYFTGGFEETLENGKKSFISINQKNCGEIVLCDADSCRLLLLNLFSYVENPFTDKAYFNFEKFKKYVRIAQRYMDDIVDIELEQIDKILNKIDSDPEDELTKTYEKNLWERIRDKCKRGRRTGTGVTGEGDMLAALGIKYGSEESINFCEQVHRELALSAFRESVNLAKERGHFEVFDFEREVDNPFLNRLYEIDPQLKEDTKKYGRRNIALLTVAPAGSVSCLTRTTSGIEPLFMPYYRRRRKINPSDKDARVDFVDDVGDSWQEYNVIHDKFLLWARVNNIDIDENSSDQELQEAFEKSPYYGACANDIDWIGSIEIQGKVQQYVDHSISKTCNLPIDATIELVDQLYKKAHEVGCKGVTIYRDGSRSGVLISKEEKENKDSDKSVNEIIKDSNAPRRPKKLECDILRFSNKGEKWIGFIGVLEDRPYEIFTGLLESFPVPNYLEKGFIKKYKNKETGEKRYDFVYIDKEGYEQEIRGLSRAFKEEYWDIAKMTSAVLRHGMPIPSVINLLDTLRMDGQFVGTWKAGVKRMLKRYIKDGSSLGEGKNLCPECGEDSLIFQDGCLSCTSCGFSKCG